MYLLTISLYDREQKKHFEAIEELNSNSPTLIEEAGRLMLRMRDQLRDTLTTERDRRTATRGDAS